MRKIYLRFAVASLAPIAALGFFLSDTVRTAIEQRTADVHGGNAQSMFRMMADTMLRHEDLTEPIPADRLALFGDLLSKVGSGDRLKVRIITRTGRVQLSTDEHEVGELVPLDAANRAALAGSVATKFTNGEPGSIIENGTRQIEIYLPVQLKGDRRVLGVIQAAGIDPTLTSRIETDVRRMRVTLAIGLAVLWASLLPILASVSRRLRRQSAEMRHLALHDTLTGLPNRNLLDDRLNSAIASTHRTGELVGLLLIDLDGFKLVNDTLGHAKGDELLQHVAGTLQATLRASDTVARLGGDEFAIVVPRAAAVDEVAEVAQRVTDALAQPVSIDGIEVSVEASIGIAVLPLHGLDGEELLQRADIAMYAAKQTHLDYVFYSPNIDSHSPTQLSLAADLRRALQDDHDQLLLHFQPEVAPGSGRVEVMEALVRWQHPRLGMLPPAEFLPMAEQSGLIRPLTTKVLDLAVAEARRWHDLGYDLSVAVNLSARNLRDFELLDVVRSTLARHGLPASRLELEVTETALLAHPEVAVELLGRLRGLGVRVALDDFGTGFSSLTYLKRLAPDRLKIDRSFVNAMTDERTDANIVRSVIELAHNLDMGVTAEGVETEEHWEKLTELRCDLLQGFYLARPLPSADALEWLRTHSADGARSSVSYR